MSDPASTTPTISREEVAYLAHLARIDLSDAELDHLAPQLAVILESVAEISQVAADDIPPSSHALPLGERLPCGREPPVPDPRGGTGRGARGRPAALQRAPDPGGGGMSDLTRLPAAALAEAHACRRHHVGRGDPGTPGPDRLGRPGGARLPPRRHRGRAGSRPRPPTNAAQQVARRPSCSASPSRSRTSRRPRGSPPPPARGSSKAGCRRTTQRWWPGCASPGSRSSARPTWTSSRWAARPSTAATARPTTRGTSSASRADPVAVRPPR